MSWKNQSSRTNTGNHTYVNTKYAFSDNPENEFPNRIDVIGDASFNSNVEISGNLIVDGTSSINDLSVNNLIVNNKLDVIGDASFNSNVEINGTISGKYINLDESNIAIGFLSGALTQGTKSIAIGIATGDIEQGDYSIAIGFEAGFSNQGNNTVAIGKQAGQTNQRNDAVAIWNNAGNSDQSNNSIAIGINAGEESQSQYCVAIGSSAGAYNQQEYAIAIGAQAGLGDSPGVGPQGANSIAIGRNAGQKNQGGDSIAIGFEAGFENQAANSIILYADGSGGQAFAVDSSGLFIKPIREVSTYDTSFVLCYNEPSGEVYYSTKTFVINHPIDETKYLVHACLEGPEAGVYYRGSAQIKDGETNVEIVLADYVKYIATDYTVNLTPIYNDKLEIPTLATSRVIDGSFRVYSNISPCDFDYIVFGKRGNINVEPNKNDVTIKGDGPYTWI